MAQKTNLNISPYYDDYDKSDQFYKVLFKPGFPVQARELSTLQSILQNQVESFGTHMFKDGSMVIPGGIAYDQEYYSLKIEEEHLGTPVTLYLNELIGLRLKGETTGNILSIDNFEYPSDNADLTNLTIYVKFLEAGDDNSTNGLVEGENLIVEETFSYGNTIINAGQSVLNLIESEDAFSVGSAVGISEGVYFIRGNFVQVNSEKIVLDPYDNLPSYRVGLSIDEQLISAKDDDSLYDNARGFSNYAAPGADRLKIKNFRNYKSFEIDFREQRAIVLGSNGIGKSNLLESIEFLSQLKSNRALSDKDLIENDSDMAVVIGQINYADDLKLNLFRKGPKRIYVNESILKKQSEIKNYIRSVCFCSNDIDIVRSEPSYRRTWMIKSYLSLNQYI